MAWVMVLPVGDGVAQTYPVRPVRILTGFGAGSPPDVIARIIGNRLSEMWGKPVIIEDVTGASGNFAADRVAKADPDGYTLLLAANSGIVVAPSLYQHLPFDPIKDLAPISQVSSYPNALVVRKDIAASNVQELVALARLRPGVLTFGSAGSGTTTHLAGELLKWMAGIDIQHVPYRGGVNMKGDLLAGRIDMYFAPVPELPQLPLDKATPLAVTSLTRNAAVPHLPTMAESGLPGFDVVAWFGLFAPARTSAEIVEKISHDTRTALAQPDVRKRYAEIGNEVIGNSQVEFASIIKIEAPRWAKFIKEIGAKLD